MNESRRVHRPLARWVFWGLAASTWLAACSQVEPYQRQESPLPAHWNAPAAPGSASAPALAWKDFIAEPQLQSLVDQALRNSLDVRTASLQAAQLQTQYQLRQALNLPTPSTEVKAGRQNLALTNNTTSVALQISNWEIDFFGRLASQEQSALAQFLASQEAQRSVQTSLVAGVAASWLNLQTSSNLLALTRQTLNNRDKSLRLVKLRFDNGTASALELRQAESLLEWARVTLAQQIQQRALDVNALTLLVGRPLNEPLTEADLAPAQGVGSDLSAALAEVPVGLPSQVLLERPDVLAAEQRLVAANALIGAARAAFFPRIALTASVGTSSTDRSNLFGSGTWGWTFIPQISTPLFSSGANQSNLASAKLGRDIALAQYQRTIQTAFREVNDALVGREALGEQYQAQQRLVQAESERLRLSELRLRQGVANQLEVLDAERSLFSAQQALVQTRIAVLQNRVALFKVLGGI
jgi:multidrug efflux system outer membrane protein